MGSPWRAMVIRYPIQIQASVKICNYDALRNVYLVICRFGANLRLFSVLDSSIRQEARPTTL